MNLVARIEFGSHLYGTNTELSDLDFKSVYLPAAREILLQRVQESVGEKVKPTEGLKNSPKDVDDEAYSLQRYLKLLSEGQTVAMDMLFAPNPLFSTTLWQEIRENKDKLITKRSAAFVGYCRQQANKYGIKGSRVSAAKIAMDFFSERLALLGTTAKVGECGDIPSGEHMRIVTKETTPGKEETYFECCNRMVGFKNTAKEAAQIFTRIYEEYGARARRAQSNDGIDWKALSHAVRVGHEVLELLATGFITFPLVNAAHILKIKQGSVGYDSVAEEIENLLLAVEEASMKSQLRDSADFDFIDSIVEREYGNVVAGAVIAARYP